jgi:hypothetical protein
VLLSIWAGSVFSSTPDDETAKYFEIALQKDPNLAEAHVGLGEIMESSEKIAQVVARRAWTNKSHSNQLIPIFDNADKSDMRLNRIGSQGLFFAGPPKESKQPASDEPKMNMVMAHTAELAPTPRISVRTPENPSS